MRILLIHPSLEKTGWYKGCEGPKVASLSLMTVAATTPKGVDVSIVDERVEDIDFDSGPDLVGITFMSRLARRAYDIAAEFRKRGSTVVFGGIHPTAMPHEASRYADAIVMHEADDQWPLLVRDFEKGRLKRIYASKEPPDLATLPFARRDLLDGKKYISRNVMQATRGCPHHCSFCFTSKFFKNTFRTKPIRNVIDEVDTFKGKEILFLDDNIIGDRTYAIDLFTALRPQKKWWFSQCDISIARDEELLRAAARSGCKCLLIGFETLSNQNLKKSRKGWSKVEDYRRAVKKLHDYGISIIASFIVGLDWDTEEVFEDTLEFLVDNKIEFMQCNPLAYFPGTDMMQSPRAMERLNNERWWLSKFPHHYEVYHTPRSISKQDLENGCVWLYEKFYSYSSIARRLMRTSLAMMISAWVVNFGFKSIVKDIQHEGYNPADRLRERMPHDEIARRREEKIALRERAHTGAPIMREEYHPEASFIHESGMSGTGIKSPMETIHMRGSSEDRFNKPEPR